MGQHASFEKTRKLSKKCKKNYGQSKKLFSLVFLSRWEENPSRSRLSPKNSKVKSREQVCSYFSNVSWKAMFYRISGLPFDEHPEPNLNVLSYPGLPISHLWPEYPGIQWQTYGPMHLPSFKHETRQRFFSHRGPLNPCGQRHLSGPTHSPPYLQGGRHTGERHAGPSNPSRHLQTFGFTHVPPL